MTGAIRQPAVFRRSHLCRCVPRTENQIAFTLRGEVFVTSADYATTKQVTHTPAREAGLSFATDNRTLAYASERGGNWQLYLAKIARKEDPNFPNATLIEEEVLLPSTTVERAYPQFSPDGKELAFIEDRIRLMVLNLETKKVRQITDGSTWYSTGEDLTTHGRRTVNGLHLSSRVTSTTPTPTSAWSAQREQRHHQPHQ